LKNSKENNLYEYQRVMLANLGLSNDDKFSHTSKAVTDEIRNLSILKSTGIGISWTALAWILYRCVFDDSWQSGQVLVIVGPSAALASQMISRMKQMLYQRQGLLFDTSQNLLRLNNVDIEAVASHHIDSARGRPSVRLTYCSELSFLPPNQARDSLDIMLRYNLKSNSWTIVETTPRAPDPSDLAYCIHVLTDSPESKSFKKLKFDYTQPGGLFDNPVLLARQMQAPGWKREFEGSFEGQVGNCFLQESVDRIITQDYSLDGFSAAGKAIGIDPSLSGTSNFAITLIQVANNKIQVLYSNEWESPVDYNHLVNVTVELMKKYQSVKAVYVDSAIPLFWQNLKRVLNERLDHYEYISDLEKVWHYSPQMLATRLRVWPVSFSKEAKQLLANLKWILDQNNPPILQVHPKFHRLITSLRTAQADEFDLIKEAGTTSYADTLDSFRLACRYIIPVQKVGLLQQQQQMVVEQVQEVPS
jgi:hypothetical protein